MRAYEFIFEARIAKKIDQQVLDDIKTAYDQGYSYDDIGSLVGLLPKEVSNILTKYYSDRKRRTVFNKEYTQKDIDDAKSAYDQGYSYDEIASVLGLSKNDVSVILGRYYKDRERRRTHGKEYTQRDIDDVKWAYDNGDSYENIAKQLGIATSDVSMMLNRYYPERKRRTVFNKVYSQRDIDDVKWAYDNGDSYENIAKQLGIDKNDVSVMLNRYYPERKRRAEHLASALTADDKKRIIFSFADGNEVSSIAKELGIAPSLVKKVVSDELGAEEFSNELARRRSLPHARITNKVKPEMIPIMKAAYKQGKSTEEIADMLDNVVTSSTVYKTLQKQPDWEDLRAEWERNRVPVRHEGPATTRVFRSGWGGASGVKGPSSKHRSPAKWWGE